MPKPQTLKTCLLPDSQPQADRLELLARNFVNHLRRTFREDMASDPRGFKKAVLRSIRRELPPRCGRPDLPGPLTGTTSYSRLHPKLSPSASSFMRRSALPPPAVGGIELAPFSVLAKACMKAKFSSLPRLSLTVAPAVMWL